jgi:FAD synthetase
MKNMKKIATFGVFDIIHVGHIKFLEKCKKLSRESKFIVVIARDSSVLKDKGKHPIINETDRKCIVASLKPVDEVILGNEGPDKLKIVEKIKPDMIVLGYDQKWNERQLEQQLLKRGLKINVIRLKKYNENNSSAIKNKIKFN